MRYLLLLSLCTGMLLTGCGKSAEDTSAESAILVDAQVAGKDTLVLSNQFVGSISPQESVYVIPLAQGTVTETFFEVGDFVEAGDVLFKIDDTGAKLQMEQAKLTYESAKQKANSALTTQQDSTNLTFDANYSSALQGYETIQLQWVKLKDQLETAEEAVNELQKTIKKLKALNTANPSDELAAQIAELQSQLKQAKSGRDSLQDAFNSINVQYESAERSLQLLKDQRALTQGAVLEDTKKQLATSLQLAEIGVNSAELALSYYTVTTPISGRVIAKNIAVNGMAAPSSPAYTIAMENSMVVTFQVSESIRNTLQVGQDITVERNGAEYSGKITEVGNAVNMQTGLFQIKAGVDATGEQLPSGVSVKITSNTYTAENELIIPYGAVYFENEGAYVYLNVDGKAVKTYVTPGIFDDTRIQIVDGIKEGDVVITSWSPRLLDGVSVDAKVSSGQNDKQ